MLLDAIRQNLPVQPKRWLRSNEKVKTKNLNEQQMMDTVRESENENHAREQSTYYPLTA